MRRVILQMGVTLDGYVAGPGGEGDWGLPPEHPDVRAWKVASLRQAGTHIMGRVTYEQMAAHWPAATGDYAVLMNDIPEASMLIRGSAAVARQAAMGIRHLLGRPAADLRRVVVSGSAGVLVTLGGQPITLMSFTVAEGKIAEIAGIADPGRVRRIAAAVLTGG